MSHNDPMQGYTSALHQSNRVASAYGYPIAEGLKLDEFQVGEGIIVINKKGEPLMSGTIEDMNEDQGVKVGGTWFLATEHIYRRL